MKHLVSLTEFLNQQGYAGSQLLLERSINIVDDATSGLIVKYIGGEDGEFKVVPPTGDSRSFFAEEFDHVSASSDNIARLKKYSAEILTNIVHDDLGLKHKIIAKAREFDIFTADVDPYDSLEDYLRTEVEGAPEEEIKAITDDVERYLKARSHDKTPRLRNHVADFLDGILYYYVGKISGYNWWVNNNQTKYNEMDARQLYAVINKKVVTKGREAGWKVSEPYDLESERPAMPGRTAFAVWNLTRNGTEIGVGAAIEPSELARRVGSTTGELTVSFFDANGDPMEGYEDIRLKDLEGILRTYKNNPES
jgi:hypothetical protein